MGGVISVRHVPSSKISKVVKNYLLRLEYENIETIFKLFIKYRFINSAIDINTVAYNLDNTIYCYR